MSVFDFFITDSKKQSKAKIKSGQAYNYNNQQSEGANSSAMSVFFPQTFEDVSAIIEVLSLGKPAVVNIKECKGIPTQRAIDILSGAIYALHGGVCMLDEGVYLFSLNGVSVQG